MKILPCLAYDPLPTVADFENGWRWWRTADSDLKQLFVKARLELVTRTNKPYSYTPCHSSGSTGSSKHYRWGPCYEALYSWFLHDLVRAGSRSGSVASLSLLGTRDHSLFTVDDTSWHPVVDRWIRIAIGPEPLHGLRLALQGHDLIMAPGHYEILDRYAGFGGLVDRSCLLLSTAEAITPYVYQSAAERGFGVRDWMRCWDGGASFFTCAYGNRHVVDMLAAVTVDDSGRLIASDLFNLAQPFVDYHNGDMVEIRKLGRCPCGLDAVSLLFNNRQDALYFVAPNGKPITYISLCFMVGRAAYRLGLSEHFALLCFGYSLTKSVLMVSYLKDLRSDLRSVFESQVSDLAKELGFTNVVVTPRVDSAERKFKRLYNLDMP